MQNQNSLLSIWNDILAKNSAFPQHLNEGNNGVTCFFYNSDKLDDLCNSENPIIFNICSFNSRKKTTFFISTNKKYLVKVLPTSSYKVNAARIIHFYEYQLKNTNSLLCKIHALFSYDLFSNGKNINDEKIYFLLMDYLCPSPSLIYDLKGKITRRTSEKENKNECPCYKDGDCVINHTFFNFHLNFQYSSFFSLLEKDLEFLNAMNSDDYSLVIGVSYDLLCPNNQSNSFDGSLVIQSHPMEKGVSSYFHCSIIDFLREVPHTASNEYRKQFLSFITKRLTISK